MIQLEVLSPFNKMFSIASSVPISTEGKVHIWGRNDTSISQNIGVHWIVKNPSGVIVQNYSDWKMGTLGLGQSHEFISNNSFDIDEEGSYTLDVELLMNSDNPVVVDSYSGVLCTVGPAGIPPEIPETCSIDSDCPEGYVCKDGKCVKKEAFPWLPVVLIGGGVAIAALATKKTSGKGKTT